MKKLLVLCSVLANAGCMSTVFPGWEEVQIVDSVFNKPCQYKSKDECEGSYTCKNWFKRMATTVGANTVVVKGETGSFFYCAPGIPANMMDPKAAWTVRNKFNASATRLDFEKTVANCGYEAHKATVDTSQAPPTRAYIPTTSYDANISQLNAIHLDNINSRYHDLHLDTIAQSLKGECMEAAGYVYKRSADKKDYDDIKANCPGIDNAAQPCFIPAH